MKYNKTFDLLVAAMAALKKGKPTQAASFLKAATASADAPEAVRAMRNTNQLIESRLRKAAASAKAGTKQTRFQAKLSQLLAADFDETNDSDRVGEEMRVEVEGEFDDDVFEETLSEAVDGEDPFEESAEADDGGNPFAEEAAAEDEIAAIAAFRRKVARANLQNSLKRSRSS